MDVDSVNGRRFSIPHDQIYKEFLGWHFKRLKLNTTDVISWIMMVSGIQKKIIMFLVNWVMPRTNETPLGIELKRQGAPDDPFEGSNVTLTCCTLFYFLTPPTWSFQVNKKFRNAKN